ncbi:hypothetical protein MRB53_024369 [Persea americana]|uniref:Uncharacterized protein n=1 Tax=Persea americana TaxID=3435 RepID=A0ACC2LC25_PERAE|nr:hypothetical protein MRB53_024369 [Persea americana]
MHATSHDLSTSILTAELNRASRPTERLHAESALLTRPLASSSSSHKKQISQKIEKLFVMLLPFPPSTWIHLSPVPKSERDATTQGPRGKCSGTLPRFT